MNLLGALIVIAGFVVLLRVLELVPRALEVTTVSRTALSVIQDQGLDDDVKGKLMQQYAKRLFMLFFLLTLGAAAALLLPLGAVWLLGQAGLFSYDEVIELLISWQFLLGTTLVAVATLWIRSRT